MITDSPRSSIYQWKHRALYMSLSDTIDMSNWTCSRSKGLRSRLTAFPNIKHRYLQTTEIDLSEMIRGSKMPLPYPMRLYHAPILYNLE